MCVCFLPIHSGHQVRWTYQPGSHRCVLINLDTNLHTNSSIIVPSAVQYPIVQVLTARRTAVSVGRVLFLTAESVDLGVATERFPGDTLNTVVVVGRTTNVLL